MISPVILEKNHHCFWCLNGQKRDNCKNASSPAGKSASGESSPEGQGKALERPPERTRQPDDPLLDLRGRQAGKAQAEARVGMPSLPCRKGPARTEGDALGLDGGAQQLDGVDAWGSGRLDLSPGHLYPIHASPLPPIPTNSSKLPLLLYL